MGQRVEQVATSGGTTTTITSIGGLEEITASGSTTTTTAYYGKLALSVNGALSYTLSDGLGSVSEAVGLDGTVTATQLYGPYGAVRYQSGTLPTSLGYTSQRADATTGLDYYGARYYDPVAGQFTSADTTLRGGLNRYAYVGGNPESSVDPSGHRVILKDRGIGSGSGTGPGGEGAGGGGVPPSVDVTAYSDVSVVTLDGGMAITVFGGAAIAVSVGVYINYYRQLHQASTSPASGPDNSAFIHQNNDQTGENDTPPPPPTPPTPPTPEHETISISSDPSPTPPTDTSGAGARKGGGRDSTTFVLGETMSRVLKYAAEHGYSTYRTWGTDIDRTPTTSQLVRNAAWLLWHIVRGHTFVDIGFDVDRETGRSANYLMELATLFQLDYPNYIRDPQPGSRGTEP